MDSVLCYKYSKDNGFRLIRIIIMMWSFMQDHTDQILLLNGCEGMIHTIYVAAIDLYLIKYVTCWGLLCVLQTNIKLFS